VIGKGAQGADRLQDHEDACLELQDQVIRGVVVGVKWIFEFGVTAWG
jgi:hypothetical protein